MRVLLGQLAPVPGDPEANADAICAALAGHPDADLAAFPELFLSGYSTERAAELAVAPDHPALGRLREAAARHGVRLLVGFTEQLAEGGVANSVACIGPAGEWVATYRKTRLFGREEHGAFTPGERLVVTELGGLRVGPLICFDVEFPEPARALAVEGAEVLVTVAANMEPYLEDHALAARARALDNRRPHVYVNRVGQESGLRFVGGSAAIRSDGSVAAVLGDEPSVTCVDLEVPEALDDANVDYLEHLRDVVVETIPTRPTHGEIA